MKINVKLKRISKMSFNNGNATLKNPLFLFLSDVKCKIKLSLVMFSLSNYIITIKNK